jgi:hypothetical protein
MEFVGQCKKSLMSWQSTTESTRGSFSRKPGLAMFRLDYLSCVLTILATILVGRKSWTGLLISMVNSFVVCIIGVRTAQFGCSARPSQPLSRVLHDFGDSGAASGVGSMTTTTREEQKISNKEVRETLHDVIESLIDGHEGFQKIGEHLKDETLKKYFFAESLKRSQFRGELETLLHSTGEHDLRRAGA